MQIVAGSFLFFLRIVHSPLLCGGSFAHYRRSRGKKKERVEITIFLTFGVGGSLYSPN